MKVNSHHLNLSAPPTNTNSCQKLRWLTAVHGWVVFDEMCEWWNVLLNVSTSFPGYCRVNYGEEMSAPPRRKESRSGRMSDSTSGYVGGPGWLWTFSDLNVEMNGLSQLFSHPPQEVVKPFWFFFMHRRERYQETGNYRRKPPTNCTHPHQKCIKHLHSQSN